MLEQSSETLNSASEAETIAREILEEANIGSSNLELEYKSCARNKARSMNLGLKIKSTKQGIRSIGFDWSSDSIFCNWYQNFK